MDTSTATVAELTGYVGGLSRPSKMPGYGYSLPAAECAVGSKLRDVAGSTCSSCYAMKGRYAFSNVQAALYRRLNAIQEPFWVDAMAELITRKGERWFRWHDSGDLQSVAHLARIVRVCELTPEVRHWLPTREYRIVSEYQADGEIPENLCIRLSAHMVDQVVPAWSLPFSTVSQDNPYPTAHHCPAPNQGNNCGSCRACWDTEVPHVDYHLH